MRAISLLALGLLGCAATAELHAKPDAVCAGRAVRLTWDGSSSGELSAEPADPSLGDVSGSGQRTVHPKTTTTYTLRVSSGLSSTTSEAMVRVLAPPAKPATVTGSVADAGSGCAPGKLWVTARIEPAAWDPHLRVDEVSSPDGRSYRVEHAGRAAEVTPAEPSGELRDLPMAGAWKISTPLGPGEECGGEKAPESLTVAVRLVCAD